MQFRHLAYVYGLPAMVTLLMSACVTQASRIPVPEEQFGHRYESGVGGRINVVVTPPDTAKSYFSYPAFIESLYVRPAPFDSAASAGSEIPVEVLVQGAFSDACSELDTVRQSRAGHILNVDLLVRRPRGQACTRLERPYRFYFRLDGRYEPGSYLLKVNGVPYTFEIRQPPGFKEK
ncbi:MAG TPA: hypothetical protein VFG50_12060 [Rhodothermales bacterium]|nr:hypothetical protein [Rhodothermales bacterium]